MKMLVMILTGLALLAGSSGAAPAPLFQNQGLLVFPPAPPIDATVVENSGEIQATDAFLLWDTQNSLFFMNRSSGRMDATLGFRFDYLRDSMRYPMQSFTNNGRIYVTDSLVISATNITVSGSPALLSADRRGRVTLKGRNVNLTNSRIRAGDSSERSNFTEGGFHYFVGNTPRYYDEPYNVIDESWGTNDAPVSLPFLSQGGVSGGNGISFDRLGFSYGTTLDVNPPNFDGLTPGYSCFIHSNVVFSANNLYRGVMQILFIQTNSVDNPQTRVFFPGARFGADDWDLREIWIEFGINDTDLITGQPISRYFYLTDSASTNATTAGLAPIRFLENFNRRGYFQANNFLTFRSDFSVLPLGFEEQPQVYQPFFIFTSTVGNGRFSTANPDSVSGSGSWTIAPRDLGPGGFGLDFTTLPVASQDPTNTPGRIEIETDQLNMRFSRMRAENLLSIRATNITDMTALRMEAPNFKLQLLSTNSDLVISNIFPTSIPRLHGTLQAWSGVWRVNQFVTNGNLFPNLPGLAGSNTIEWVYQVMVVEQGPSIFTTRPYADTLKSNVNTSLIGLTLNGPSVVLNDDITVEDAFLINGRSLHIPPAGALTLGPKVPNFTATIAPNLVWVTNEGSITVPQTLNMGFDRSYGYSNIINTGSIQASSMLFRTIEFLNTGFLTAPFGTIAMEAITNRLAATSLLTAGDNVEFTGRELAVGNSFINVGGIVKLDLIEHLTDEGQTNFWTMFNGFDMSTKPSKGDLLSTTFYTIAQPGFDVLHFWNGEDRGDDPSGYLNNVALGRITLDGGDGSRHVFFGTSANNALYVDTLEFANNATNFTTALYVDPSLTIYFANTSPNVAPEKLTNAHPGRLIWVSPTTYQGPMLKVQASMSKTMDVAYRANLNLFSAIEDSDGDGIVNKRDVTPLSGFTVNNITMTTAPQPMVLLTWQAVAGYSYTVEYTTDLKANDWHALDNMPMVADLNKDMTVGDPVNVVPRFYRVKYTRP